MLMYHPNAAEPISVHPEQAANLRNRGWSDEPPSEKKAKVKPEPIPAETNDEVNDG
jgi:hypothetical protein